MIVTLGHTKGGVGKTTLAINLTILLAGQGSRVLLVDGDKQGASFAFTELRRDQRGEAGYVAERAQGDALHRAVVGWRRAFGHIVIDVGGQNTDSLRAAMMASDLLLVPVPPRTLDLWATADELLELVGKAQAARAKAGQPPLRVAAFVSQADPRGGDNAAVLEQLRELPGVEALDVMVGRRKAFPDAVSAGLGATEMRPRDEKACAELTALAACIR